MSAVGQQFARSSQPAFSTRVKTHSEVTLVTQLLQEAIKDFCHQGSRSIQLLASHSIVLQQGHFFKTWIYHIFLNDLIIMASLASSSVFVSSVVLLLGLVNIAMVSASCATCPITHPQQKFCQSAFGKFISFYRQQQIWGLKNSIQQNLLKVRFISLV